MQKTSSTDVAPAPVEASNGLSTTKIVVLVILGVAFVFTGATAIALGVGLGIGLRKHGSNKTNNTDYVYSSNTTNKTDCVYSSSTCGCPATKPTFVSTKIINGYNATAHSWPWMVSIYVDDFFNCGGFLAESYQFVITAAHCLVNFDPSSIRIYAGLQSQASRTSAQYRNVSNWNTHPDYSGYPLYMNDIAVIKLTSSFDMNQNVGLCCLPSGTTQLPVLNDFAVIAGWGTTVSGDLSTLSDTLLQAIVQIQGPSRYCDATATSDIQFCAGYGTSDTCQGDSGGPVISLINKLWTCTGIVSYGNGGCGHSGYYTRVSHYRSYIDNQTATL